MSDCDLDDGFDVTDKVADRRGFSSILGCITAGCPEGFDSAALCVPEERVSDLTPKQVAQLAKVVKHEFSDETEDV